MKCTVCRAGGILLLCSVLLGGMLLLAACSGGGSSEVTVALTFQPPDSLTYHGSVVSERILIRDADSTTDSTIMFSSHVIVQDGNQWLLTSTTDSIRVLRDGVEKSDPLTALYPGIDFVLTIDSAGEGIDLTGFEEVLRRADSALEPGVAQQLRRTLRPDLMERRELNEWNGRVARFANQEVAVGEIQYDTSSLAMPNGESLTYYRAAKLTSTETIDGTLCAHFSVVADNDPNTLAERLEVTPEEVYTKFGIDATAHDEAVAGPISSSLQSDWVLETGTMLLRSESIEKTTRLSMGQIQMKTIERREKSFRF